MGEPLDQQAHSKDDEVNNNTVSAPMADGNDPSSAGRSRVVCRSSRN
jgi:hypothetical protein